MKKIITLVLIGFALFVGNAFATVCSDFDAGKICLWLKNVWSGKYTIEKTFKPKEKKYSYKLECQVLTPDNYIKEMWLCNWTFEYSGKWIGKIEYYVSLEWQRKIIKDTYDFTNNPDPYFENDSDDEDNGDDSDDDQNNSSDFTAKQLKDIKYVYNIWPNFVKKIERKYPKLMRSSQWQDFQWYLYDQLERFIDDNNSDITNYEVFKDMMIDFIKLTKQER